MKLYFTQLRNCPDLDINDINFRKLYKRYKIHDQLSLYQKDKQISILEDILEEIFSYYKSIYSITPIPEDNPFQSEGNISIDSTEFIINKPNGHRPLNLQ